MPASLRMPRQGFLDVGGELSTKDYAEKITTPGFFTKLARKDKEEEVDKLINDRETDDGARCLGS